MHGASQARPPRPSYVHLDTHPYAPHSHAPPLAEQPVTLTLPSHCQHVTQQANYLKQRSCVDKLLGYLQALRARLVSGHPYSLPVIATDDRIINTRTNP